VAGGKPIAVLLQSISGRSAINPLVALYDIHGEKIGAILLFCPGHHTKYSVVLLWLLKQWSIDLKLRDRSLVQNSWKLRQSNKYV
jgi:hypothetical protein